MIAGTVRLLALLALLAAQGPGKGQTGAQRHGARIVSKEDIEQEPGEVSSLPPPVESAGAPARIHEDRDGRALHVPMRIAGIEGGGFAVAWRDTRDGTLGLYVARVGLDGAPLAAERPFSSRGESLPELEPALALNEKGEGAVAWHAFRGTGRARFFVRSFDREGRFRGREAVVTVPPSRARDSRGESLEEPLDPVLLPALAVDRDGDVHCAWTFDGLVYLREVRADGELGDLRLLESAGPPAAGALILAGSGGGPELCVWNTDQGVWLQRLGHSRRPSGPAGPGRALEVLPVREQGRPVGWWMLVDLGDRVVLRGLTEAGERRGEDVPLGATPPGRVDLALWSEGLVVLHQPESEPGSEGFVGGPFELRFLTPDGRGEGRAPLPVVSADGARVLQPMVAGAGDRLLVVWGERAARATDVFYRLLLASEARLGPPRRLNSDEASSDQVAGRIAAAGGDRAVVVWEDHRDGRARVYARGLSSGGELLTPELALPLVPESGEARPHILATRGPRVAMGPDGSFAVLWGNGAGGLRCQAFTGDGSPLGPHRGLGEEVDLDAGYRIARQETYRSWLATWSGEEGIFLQRVHGDGSPLLRPVPTPGGPGSAHPALTELDDGRVVLVADTGPARARKLAALLFDADLAPAVALRLPATWHGSAAHPEVAPGDPEDPGSFLVSWVAGTPPATDVLAVLIGSNGRPASRVRAISTLRREQDSHSLARLSDGSWAVAWEDDLSLRDSAYVRRIFPGARVLGPVRLLSHRTDGHQLSAFAPCLAAVDSGLVATWVDAQRGRGFDVWFRPVGADFDGHPSRGR